MCIFSVYHLVLDDQLVCSVLGKTISSATLTTIICFEEIFFADSEFLILSLSQSQRVINAEMCGFEKRLGVFHSFACVTYFSYILLLNYYLIFKISIFTLFNFHIS